MKLHLRNCSILLVFLLLNLIGCNDIIMYVYSGNFDELHTSESIIKKFYWNEEKKELIIPYINLALSEHELNPREELCYIDYSYAVMRNVYFLKINDKVLYDDRNRTALMDERDMQYLGGYALNDDEFYDIEVMSDSEYLVLLPESKISPLIWKFDLDINLNNLFVRNFLKCKYLDMAQIQD